MQSAPTSIMTSVNVLRAEITVRDDTFSVIMPSV